MSDPSEKDSSSHNSSAVKYSVTKILKYVDKLFDIDNHKFLVGLNSCLVAAVITTSYGNPALATIARIILPPISGVIAARSWHYFITEKINSRELKCPVCAYMRGFVIATAAASLIPLTVGGLVVARRSKGFLVRAEKFTENFSDNFMRRPILVAAVLTQGGTGYIMANREFEKSLIQRLRNDRDSSGTNK